MKNDIKTQTIAKAVETRSILNIGPNESVDIFKLLREKENLSIIIAKMSDKISGLFMRKSGNGLVVINGEKSLGHQYFTAAHEYYHIKYDDGMTANICPITHYDTENKNELSANYFASYFLMPDESLKYNVYKRTRGNDITIADVIFLENHFLVGHAIMLKRLQEIGELNEQQLTSMKNGISSTARTLGYPTKLYEKTICRTPIILSEYAEVAKELLDANRITYGKYEELMIDGGYMELIYGTVMEDNMDEEANSF